LLKRDVDDNFDDNNDYDHGRFECDKMMDKMMLGKRSVNEFAVVRVVPGVGGLCG